nr:fatty acid--CoA ligase family protein [uncultured Lichenicoccus sp.]
MPQSEPGSLLQSVLQAASNRRNFIADPRVSLPVAAMRARTSLGARLGDLRGHSVMLVTHRQITTILAAMELDGVARRIVLCPPGLTAAHLDATLRVAEIDTVIVDEVSSHDPRLRQASRAFCTDVLEPTAETIDRSLETQWVLLTSGTTGAPKLALHSMASLTAPIGDGLSTGEPVWSTFYDIRRYGGLQILLRALVGGGSLVLSDAGEPVDRFLARAAASGVTHISGTPSHWRGALMSDAAGCIMPGYLRLSGEACDQPMLDRLKLAYPQAAIAHAFASTEAGVAFDVKDGLAGFPAAFIGPDRAGVEMRIQDGSLRIRSSRTASRYLGDAASTSLRDEDGFIDTGDLIDVHGDRCRFIGRRGGVINVGGMKVHPEAIEAVINEHPAIHTSRVSGRPSPITGAIVVAEIVLKQGTFPEHEDFAAVRRQVRELCQSRLSRHQVPMTFQEVRSLEVAPSGKMARMHA